MPGLKEIESRLRTVHNTKKITYAMKLVAAAKLRKAQEAVQRSRVYSDSLAGLLRQLSAELSGNESSYALMEKRETVKNVRLVVIGGARGLCGGYNSNLHRKVEAAITEIQSKHPGATVSATLLGRKPAEYFRRVNRSYTKALEELPEDVSRWPIDDVCREIETDFISGAVDAVYLVFTRFKSALSQSPTVEMILPLDPEALTGAGTAVAAGEATATNGVSIFEPSPQDVFTAVLPRVFRTKVRQAALDAKASETGARMTAMDAATKNAGELMKTLTRLRNKLRQGKITSQLLDIVGGAEAIS
jgi:F-type H+-transporting ATPase subunit gamma